jgi:dipeptidase
MKNIKTIRLIDSVFGLDAGTLLSRNTPDEPFYCAWEHIADGYTAGGDVSVTESLLRFSSEISYEVVEYFQDKRSAKHVIKELEAKLEEKTKEAEEYKEMYYKDASELKKLLTRMNDKRAEFKTKMDETQTQLENDFISGEAVEWADEAMTVYYNLIDLIDKLLK